MDLVDELHLVLDDLMSMAPARGDQKNATLGCHARVVILIGTGKGFCSGADLKGCATGTDDRKYDFQELATQQRFSSLITKLRTCPQPIICGVHGYASGAGFALATAADIRIATPSAKFQANFLSLGLSGCEMGISFFLPRLVGWGVANEILLTDQIVDASRAHGIGLVSVVTAHDDQLRNECQKWAEAMLRSGSKLGLQLTKDGLNRSWESSALATQLAIEDRQQIILSTNQEALNFAKQKRPPPNPRAKL